MGIISVSRELAALGDTTAQELAKLLDYRFVDKNTLEERIKSYGVDVEKLERFDERRPSFIASLLQDRDDYLHYLKTAILTEAEEGNCVFIGRGASLVLKNLPGHVGIFLAAPIGIRIERVKNYFHCDERRALQIIEHSDQQRIGFHRYFFEIDWKEPRNYHLTFNTGVFSPTFCAEITKQIHEQHLSPETEAQSKIRLHELILEQKIKHEISYEKDITIHFLEVTVDGDAVTLHGVGNSQALIEAAAELAKELAGDVKVYNEIRIVQDQDILQQ